MVRTNKTAPAAGARKHQGACTPARKVPVEEGMSGQADAFGGPGVALLAQLARHVTVVLPASRAADSHRTAPHRTDPAETLPGPDRRREGAP